MRTYVDVYLRVGPDGHETPEVIALPDGRWQVLADDESSTRWQEAAPALLTGRAEAPAAGALILGRVSI